MKNYYLKFILTVIFLITIFLEPNYVSAKDKNLYIFTLRPGESKTITIPINNSSNPFNTSYIIITGQNANRTQGDANVLGTSQCIGVQSAMNALGNTIYQWHSIAQYDFTGTTVDIWGHTGTPSSWWGWEFDHDGWVVNSNGTATASAFSTGYFKNIAVGREYARIKFVIQKNGTCTMSGSVGTW